MPDDPEAIRRTLARHRERLLARANVVATGIGYKVTAGRRTDALGIVCSVVEKVGPAELSGRDLVPRTLEGVPTDVVRTGHIRALQARTARHRPAPGGVSIGHRDITAGTLGCLVRKEGRVFILSNNHVLANSNDAQPGDAILQPGPHDGGRDPEDRIAELADFVPISFVGSPSDCLIARGTAGLLSGLARAVGSEARLIAVSTSPGENRVDAALARPLREDDVSDSILEIGAIEGVIPGELGMAVRKSGRTTALTSGEILQVDVTVNVQYGAGRIARFGDQLLAGPMSQGGDSGSAVVDERGRLVGLLFAGSDSTTIVNRIEHVFEALGVGV